MRYLSVCSGVEAATLAFYPLGWTPAAFAEVDPFCCALLKERFPNVPNLGDITAKGFVRKAKAHGPIRLLVGGTPCQSFSVAGLRGGLADDRGNLALRFLRIADALRPAWVLWENVPGVLSSLSHDAPDPCPPPAPMDLGCDGAAVETEDEYCSEELHAFHCFVAGLSELGYGWAYRVLDAQHFGVPQRRRRVFVVGYLGDWRRAAAVLFERHCLQGHPPPRRQAGQGVAPSVTPGARRASGNRSGEQLTVSDTFVPEVANSCRTQDRRIGQGWNQTMVAATLRSRQANPGVNPPGRGGEDDQNLVVSSTVRGDTKRIDSDCTDTLVTRSLRADGFDGSEDGTGRETPLVPVYSITPDAFDREGEGSGGTLAERPGLGIIEGQTQALRAKRPNAVGPVPIDMRQASRGEKMTNNRTEGKASGGAPGTGIGEAGDPAPSLAESHTPAVAYQCHGSNVGEMGTIRTGNQGVTGGVPFVVDSGAPEEPDNERRTKARGKARRRLPVPGVQGQEISGGRGTGDDPGPDRADVAAFNIVGLAQEGKNHAYESEISGCLQHKGLNVTGNEAGTVIKSAMAVRRLTPMECERLQGMPDGWTLITYRGKPAADGPRYRAIGNSMAVPCMRWLGERIALVEALP